MKVVQINGFLGSGKTTLLIELAKLLVGRGKKVSIIVNDVGEVKIDLAIIEAYGLKVKELPGGCICCDFAGNFADALSIIHHEFKPDIVLVEPSGVAIPWRLKRAAQSAKDESAIAIEHAPVITLMDATCVDILMGTIRRLVISQVREADVCLINKIDAADDARIARTEEFVSSVNPRCEIMRISVHRNQGIMEVADIIVGRTSSRYDETMGGAMR